MNLTKVFALILMMSFGVSLHAQRHMKKEKRDMFHRLDLTEDQKTEMKKIHEELRGELERIDDQKLSERRKLQAKEQARSSSKVRAFDILTDEQAERLNKMERSRKGKGHGMYEILKSLDLTDAQIAELKAFHMEQKKAHKMAREEGFEHKSRRDMTDAEREAMRTKHLERQKETDEKLRSILTKEQFKKYEIARKKQMEERKAHMKDRREAMKERRDAQKSRGAEMHRN